MVVNQDNLTVPENIIDKNSTVAPPVEFTAVKNYYMSHKDTLHWYITNMLKNYFMYNGDRAAQLKADKETWRTNIKSPLTHMYVSGVYNMTVDSDVRYVCIDKKWDKEDVVNAILDLAEYIYWQEETDDSLWSAIFDAILLWFGYYESTYVYKEYDVEAMNKDGSKDKFKDKLDYAALRYISPYNLFWPKYKNSLDRRMIMKRRLVPATAIEKEYAIYWAKFNLQLLKDTWTYVDDRDWEAVKENIPFYNSTDGRDIYEDDTYNIKDKMLEVFEVHTDTSISIWCQSIYIWTFNSLGPLKRIRLYEISFKKIPGMKKGIGVWYIVKPIQDVYDAILNMRLDNVKLTLNKVFFMDQSANIFGNTNTMKLKPWAIYKVRDVNQVKEMEMSEIKQSAYTELDSMFQLTQWLIGVSAPGLGMQQKVERTAAWADILKNAADNQLKPLLKSVSRSMNDALKDLIILSHYYMDNDTLENVCWKEWAKALKDVKISDLMKDFSFSYDMTSQSSQNLAIKKQQLQSLLTLAQSSMDFGQMPVLDAQKIALELAKCDNLDFDVEMTPEKIEAVLQRAEEIRQKVQSKWVWIPTPGEWGDFTMSKWTDPVASENEAINAVNQIPWAWVPTELAPNPEGKIE